MSLHRWHCSRLPGGCSVLACLGLAHAGTGSACSCCTLLAEQEGPKPMSSSIRPSRRNFQSSLAPALDDPRWLQILLQPSQQELEQRLQQRAAAHTHFMPASLLQSQLALLEVDSSCMRYGERLTLFILPPAALSSSYAVTCRALAVEPWQANRNVL